jgi:cell division protein FtsX
LHICLLHKVKIAIAFSLFAFGLFGLVAINIRSALVAIEDRVEIRAFLVDGVADGQVDELMRGITKMPQVADVGYVSPDSALQRAKAELEEFRDVMDGAMLPGSVELRLKEGARDPETVQAISRRLQNPDDLAYALDDNNIQTAKQGLKEALTKGATRGAKVGAATSGTPSRDTAKRKGK